MAGNLDAELRILREELAAIATEWNQIGMEFGGPAPELPCTPAEWADAVELILIFRSDPGELPEFQLAWSETASATRNLLLSRLAMWASQVIAGVGADYFAQRDIPDPPVHDLPLASRYSETAETWLTGTANTVEAGRRIIFWLAAYSNPIPLFRSAEFTTLASRWAGGALDFYASDEPRLEGEHQGKLVGKCYPIPELMDWVRQAFESLHQTKSAGGGRAHTSEFVLEKFGNNSIVVQFEHERGVMKGVAAFRIQKLLANGRLHVFELGGDHLAGATEWVSDPSEAESFAADEEDVRFHIPSRKRNEFDDFKSVRKEISRLDAAIGQAESDVERMNLEKQRDQYHSYVNSGLRVDSTQLVRAKERVERSIRTLKSELHKSMPKFVEHLDKIQFDGHSDSMVYDPGDRPSWKFEGFG